MFSNQIIPHVMPPKRKLREGEVEQASVPASPAKEKKGKKGGAASVQASPVKEKKGKKDSEEEADAAAAEGSEADAHTASEDEDDEVSLAEKQRVLNERRKRAEKDEAEWEKEKNALQAKVAAGTIGVLEMDASTLAIVSKKMGIWDLIRYMHHRQVQVSLSINSLRRERSRRRFNSVKAFRKRSPIPCASSSKA